MEPILINIISKYKLDNIARLSIPECEEAMMVIRYLKNRCEDAEMLEQLEDLLGKLTGRKENLSAISNAQCKTKPFHLNNIKAR